MVNLRSDCGFVNSLRPSLTSYLPLDSMSTESEETNPMSNSVPIATPKPATLTSNAYYAIHEGKPYHVHGNGLVYEVDAEGDCMATVTGVPIPKNLADLVKAARA